MANTITTTSTTTTNIQNTIGINVSSQSNTQTIGNLVTDVTLTPYIASRIISFYAHNMRPNQRMHIFFDSVLIDSFCAPGIVPTTISDTSDYTIIQKNGNWGDAITSDSNGKVAGQFNVPAATFKTGNRILEIADVTNLTQGNSAITTSASAGFTASDLSVTKQVTTLTTVNPIIKVVPDTSIFTTTNTFITSTFNTTAFNPFEGGRHDPIAQSLYINTPQNQAGIFTTSIDIYFKQTSLTSNNGVSLYLCDTDNGLPDSSTILPFSIVHKNKSEVNISATGTIATRFTFESPVFLNNNRTYAFVVKPDANDPDYQIFTAQLGDLDLTSGYQVFSQPVVGTAFISATSNAWTPLQSEYVKFGLNRANFANSSGIAVFNNSDTDYLSVYNIAYTNNSLSLLPGDYVYQAINATPTTVNTSISGILNYFDIIKSIVYVSNSTGLFTSNSVIQIHRFTNNSVLTPNTSTIIAYANTSTLYNPVVDSLVSQFATIAPSGTSLSFDYSGTSNSYVTETNKNTLTLGYENEFYDQERIVSSKSNEIAKSGGLKSLTIRSTLTSDSEFISPIIDMAKYNQLAVANKIDIVGFKYSEFFNSSNSQSKYVSQIITLADGQDAQDLQVLITGFRPPNSDIEVFVKFLSGTDSDSITAKTWTPLINQSSALYSSPSNPTDYKEFSFAIPQFYGLIPTTGTITANATSNTITGVGTLFTTELSSGWYINMQANSTFNETSRQIVAITNSTSLTLNSSFNGTYANTQYFLVPPPTTAWLSTNTSVLLSGTVSSNTTSNIITGANTSFNTQFTPGNIININGGDQQTVISITNSTSLSVGTTWSSALANTPFYKVSPAGLTYLNNTNNLYSTFKRFQIKIVLQSNDSSSVPILNDLRCLALQL